MVTFDIEAAILGSLIAHGERAGEFLPELRVEDFNAEAHQVVFSAIERIFAAGDVVNALTVSHAIQREGIEREDAEAFVRGYAGQAPDNPAQYIRMLLEDNRLAELHTLGTALSFAPSIDEAEKVIQQIAGTGLRTETHNAVSALQAALDFADRQDRRTASPDTYIRWGIEPLDRELYVQPGDFVLLGGRPSAGKTLLALQFALHMAKRYRVGFVSLETSRDKLVDRAIANLSGVPLAAIKNPASLTADEHRRISAATESFSKLNLEIVDRGIRTVQQLKALALNRRYDIVFLDYLQILQGAGRTRYEAITNISQELHVLAQQHKICVVSLAQLSREGAGGEPGMENLRESGQLEQDADAVMLLYLADSEDAAGDRRLKLAKNKEGETLSCTLEFYGATQRLDYRRRT